VEACAGRAVGPDARTAEACSPRFLFTLSFDAENAQGDEKWDGLYEGFVIPDTHLTNR